MDIEDIDPSKMAILSLKFAPTITNTGDTDWLCGHCEETLLHKATDRANEGVVFRCPIASDSADFGKSGRPASTIRVKGSGEQIAYPLGGA